MRKIIKMYISGISFVLSSFLTLVFLFGYNSNTFAQNPSFLDQVNLFVGTAISKVPTKWGKEGGTYPGAVAPFGYIQISPETSVAPLKGYYYSDKEHIYFFSCMEHYSGYPMGSTGKVQLMPVISPENFQPNSTTRPFSHDKETAHPGYYKVELTDNGTWIETTATTRSGIFRIHFPENTTPHIYLGDVGEIEQIDSITIKGNYRNSWFQTNRPIVNLLRKKKGVILNFAPEKQGSTIVEIRLSSSTVSHENAELNVKTELGDSTFSSIVEKTEDSWKAQLQKITIEDNNESHKRTFYSALYHASLLPWVISDVDGSYRESDGRITPLKGGVQYGGFSTWDTYRTLHPLLILLDSKRQTQMVASLLRTSEQTGLFPAQAMTGNHSVPVIVDSYLKGIPMDTKTAYNALLNNIDRPPFRHEDLERYHEIGYVPASISESVTKTVEYAYDDWSLAQFSKVTNHQEDYERFLQRSNAYQNLFHSEKMQLLPRDRSKFWTDPGNFGYKEGNAQIYSYAVAQRPYDLINLMGGKDLFVQRLDTLLRSGEILFDNETIFHIPWLFNYAQAPEKTQEWVRSILNNRFSDSPGGIPGNDDLGSMSSWYLFSASGFFPTAPGNPVYDLAAPLFKKIHFDLPEGKTLIIENEHPDYPYIKSIEWNNKPLEQLWISHEKIAKGGVLRFHTTQDASLCMGKNRPHKASEDFETPDFSLETNGVSASQTVTDELFYIYYILKNKGSLGTHIATLFVDGKPYSTQNRVVSKGKVLIDSIPCRLYKTGKVAVQINESVPQSITVSKRKGNPKDQYKISKLLANPMVHLGDSLLVSYSIQNIGWEKTSFNIPITVDGKEVYKDEVSLEPGSQSIRSLKLYAGSRGFHNLKIKAVESTFKVFDEADQTILLNLSLRNRKNDTILDASGFENHAKLQTTGPTINNLIEYGDNTQIKIPKSPSLDNLEKSLTMMAWVKPNENSAADILAKGDHHVLQVTLDKKLNFFAGGWGRGECTVPLPSTWKNHWHHIAGVCDGSGLKLYIDGKLVAKTNLDDSKNLMVAAPWSIGRNSEFPGERIFKGNIDQIRVFSEALNSEEIQRQLTLTKVQLSE
ncbi:MULTISPECIES: GH92 family glycosyl hydrolase [Flavobacteriaceae]|uniref:GH92 family glycosyl hydrolase n=1 Tax=Flavobacteriaceae TaxID=49546 RepID=UPI001491AB15|nr:MULTISPECIES: GH92 family glycosyl hydrolase [Allomuricauda]MDC6365859.1 GH92 family glycosyl hydrolase [Muricauda sp. AC10]